MVIAERIPWRLVLKLQSRWLGTVAIVAGAVSLAHAAGHDLPSTPTPFQIVGTALALLMAFRNSAAYDRWWEGRKLWGAIVNAGRSLARQATTLVDGSPDDGRLIVLRHVAWAHALVAALRGRDAAAAAAPWLPADEVAALAGVRNVPAALLHAQGVHVARLQRQGRLLPDGLHRLDASLTELANAQGGCERIATTPLPLAYRFFTHQFVHGFVVLLPIGLVEALGPFTVFVALLVALVFLVAEAIGRLLEQPFTEGVYGLPLSSIARNIEIDLRQRLGDADLPSPLAPVRVGPLDLLS